MSDDWQQHYEETMGAVPPVIATMYAMEPGFGAEYTELRKLVYAEREGGLPDSFKELLFVILDLVVDNPDGALNHLAAARRAGLTAEQLREALLIAFMMLGVSSWGKMGARLWESFERGDG